MQGSRCKGPEADSQKKVGEVQPGIGDIISMASAFYSEADGFHRTAQSRGGTLVTSVQVAYSPEVKKGQGEHR